MVATIAEDPETGLKNINNPAVERLIRRLSEHLHQQFDNMTELGMTRSRLDSTAWITVTENPDRPLEAQQEMARIPLWIFTVDDLIDQHAWSLDELSERIHAYERILRGEAIPSERDPLAVILEDICQALQQGPYFFLLGDAWRESFLRMLTAMREESRIDGTVDFDRYMAGAEYSIGVPTYVLGGWITSPEANLGDHLDSLMALLHHASWAIRLANDLRTFAKEEMENNQNAVTIMTSLYESQGRRHADALAAAQQFVRRRMADAMEAINLAEHPTPLHRNLARLTRATLALYHVGDFHTLGSDTLWSPEGSGV